jgi:hypothetical protein
MILISPLLIESCNSRGGSESNDRVATKAVDTLPDDFVAFFDRFSTDSAYQMEHIIFPLEGLPTSTGDGDTLTTTRYFWQKADLKIHNRFTDPGHDFEQWYEVLNDRVIEHWIQMKGTNLCMKRRFARLEDGWYLIYYQGLRPTNRE